MRRTDAEARARFREMALTQLDEIRRKRAEGDDLGLASMMIAYQARLEAFAAGGWDDPRVRETLGDLLELKTTANQRGNSGYLRPAQGSWDAFGDGSPNTADTIYTVTLADHVGPTILAAVRHGILPESEAYFVVDALLALPVHESPFGDYLPYSDSPTDQVFCTINVSVGAAAFLRQALDAGIGRPGQQQLIDRLSPLAAATYEVEEPHWWPYAYCTDPDNQTYTVSPAGDQSVATGATPQFTVSGISAEQVDIALIPCEDVTNENGVVSFKDADKNGVADDLGTGNASISSVDGTATGGAPKTINNADPDAGTDDQIAFKVTSAQDECVVAVVFADEDNDNNLDLGSNGQPSEEFAATGSVQFTPGEASFGTHTSTDVTRASTADDYFISSDDTENDGPETFSYDSNDTFQFGATSVTMGQFEGMLSAGDEINVVYNPEPAATSTFNVVTDAVAAPKDVKATVSDTDSDGTQDDVTVTWTASTQADAVYDVYRDNNPADDVSDSAELVSNNVSGTTATLTNQPNGTYDYIVVAQSPLSQAESDDSGNSADVTVPNDPTAPTSTDATVTGDDTVPGVADSGDVWRVTFSEAVTVANGDIVRVQDADGEFSNVTLNNGGGGDATWNLNASQASVGGTNYGAGQILTITLTGAPGIDGDNNSSEANTGLLEYPLEIIGQAGITDASNNAWTPGDDADNTLETTGDTSGTATMNATPSIVSAVADASANTITVTYTEPVDCNDTLDGQFAYSDTSGAGTPTALACDGDTTLVVTMTAGDIVAGDNGDLTYTESATAANRVVDADGNEADSPDTVTANAVA